MSRPRGRAAGCSRADASRRLRRAEEFLYVADLVLGEEVAANEVDDAINLSGVAAALAVLMAEDGLAPLVRKAVAAARKRSEELSG